jgi:hypothetical protein
VSRDSLLETLRNVRNGVLNLRGGGPRPAQARVFSYLEWATEAARILDYVVSPADISRLVLTAQSSLPDTTSDGEPITSAPLGLRAPGSAQHGRRAWPESTVTSEYGWAGLGGDVLSPPV